MLVMYEISEPFAFPLLSPLPSAPDSVGDPMVASCGDPLPHVPFSPRQAAALNWLPSKPPVWLGNLPARHISSTLAPTSTTPKGCMLNPDTPVTVAVPKRTALYKSALRPDWRSLALLRSGRQKNRRFVLPSRLSAVPESTMSEAMQYPSERSSRGERVTTSCGECRRRKQKVKSVSHSEPQNDCPEPVSDADIQVRVDSVTRVSHATTVQDDFHSLLASTEQKPGTFPQQVVPNTIISY